MAKKIVVLFVALRDQCQFWNNEQELSKNYRFAVNIW